MGHILFTYGTLKRGFVGHGFLAGRSAFLGASQTALGNFCMAALPWIERPGESYPGAIEKGHGFISGEVFTDISDDTLHAIDSFENIGTDYKRERVRLINGVEAWMYISINVERQRPTFNHPNIKFNPQARQYSWA